MRWRINKFKGIWGHFCFSPIFSVLRKPDIVNITYLKLMMFPLQVFYFFFSKSLIVSPFFFFFFFTIVCFFAAPVAHGSSQATPQHLQHSIFHLLNHQGTPTLCLIRPICCIWSVCLSLSSFFL